MKYRLTKDIPGMGNKGDEFEMGPNISRSVNDLTLCVIQILHTLGSLEEVEDGNIFMNKNWNWPNCNEKNKIELWEEMPRRSKMIWSINSLGEVVEIEILGASWEKFLFKSKNMHKTRESAEEALRLIMES